MIEIERFFDYFPDENYTHYTYYTFDHTIIQLQKSMAKLTRLSNGVVQMQYFGTRDDKLISSKDVLITEESFIKIIFEARLP